MFSRSSGLRCVLLASSCVVLCSVVRAEENKLEWQEKGMSGKAGYYQPNRATLTDERPKSVTKLPEGLEKPRFIEFKFGPVESPTTCVAVLDEPSKDKGRLWVDSNANGDLTDDPPAAWQSRMVPRGELKLVQYSGGATVQVAYGEEKRNLSLQMYRFDPEDPSRAALKNNLFYYRDSGYSGKVKIGEKEFKALLMEDGTTGDYRGSEKGEMSGVSLLLDLNDNDQFELRGERFDIRKPFNIGGTTYEIAKMTPKGDSFEIIKSDKQVEEKVVPAVVKKGKKPPTFEAKTLDGKTIRFPQDFEGRLVMLDFWATWCGPCREELPNLRKVYEEFHTKGFDVLGISLDDPDDLEKVNKFLKESNMAWQQVLEPGGFDARLPSLYGVEGIPACWLIDGKSGLIVADSGGLRGSALRDTIERRLQQLGQPYEEEAESEEDRKEDPLLVKAREQATKDSFPNGIQFGEWIRSPKMESLTLQPASDKVLRGRDIAQRAAQAHVRCGWIYQCTKCNRWHMNLAGGYAITSNVIVTAFHVIEQPNTVNLEKAYPIAVIGDDRIVPLSGVLAADQGMDTAVLKIAADDLKPLSLNADSRAGDTIFCLSDPQGIRGYFSSGMINRQFSVKSDSDELRHQRIHVSASWAGGSSGSAVLDEYGNAIGHVVRMQSLFNTYRGSGGNAQNANRTATVLNLHEAVPARAVLSLLAEKKDPPPVNSGK